MLNFIWRARLSAFCTGAVLAGVLLQTIPARATLSGRPPAFVSSYRLWGSAAVTGNTLTYDDGVTNFALIPGGTDGLVGELPVDAEIQAAYLFWSASYNPGSPDFIDPDHDLRFSTPSGGSYNLSVDFLEPGESPSAAAFNRCVTVQEPASGLMQSYYMCRRDVTQQVAAGSWYNGAYHVDDVDAVVGNCDVDPLCQAKYAGWSLIIVWSAASEKVRRDVVLYDGFYLFDEEQGPPFSTGVSPFFTLGHFAVGDSPRGSLSFFGLEGDEQLGVPPQDLQGCPTCFDFFEVYSEQNSTRTKLSDDVNPPNNVFNGSRSRGGMSPGIDLDTFDIGSLLRSGDSYLRFRVGSGDGIEGGELGGGELALLGYVIISLETYAPNLDDTGTYKSVAEDRASPGSVLHYTIRVVNQDGSAAAHNVLLRDPMPAGTVYVPGTTTACGLPVVDVGGRSPLETAEGLSIGTLFERPPGVQACEVKFQARILDGTLPGTDLRNLVTITSNETEPFTREAHTLVEGIQLGTPTKIVDDLDGGDLLPGDALSYTLALRNDSDGTVAGIEISDLVPPELENIHLLLFPSGAVNASAGNNILVREISIAPHSTASLVISASVRMGTPSGTVIANQGLVTHATLPDPIFTDDPTTSLSADPTLITVQYSTDLHSSTKAGIDVNGGDPEPGDVLRYTITVNNTGSISANAHVVDDLPFGVENCRMVHRPSGSTVACFSGGAQGAGLVSGDLLVAPGASRQIVFEVNIAQGAAAGMSIINHAELTYDENPSDTVQVSAAPFVVVAGPVLLSSYKQGVDLDGAPTRPGDRLRYTIVVVNTGNRPALNVVVRDRIDPKLEAIVPDLGGTFDGSAVYWNATTTPALQSLALGAQLTLTFTARVRADVDNNTVLRNVAALTSDEISVPVLLRANPLLVRAAPILSMQKTVQDLNAAPYAPNDRVRYTLVIRNDGDAPATQVTVRDLIDPLLRDVVPDAGGQLVADHVQWSAATTAALASIAVGASVTLHFDATVIDRVVDGAVVSNQATLDAAELARPVLSDDPSVAGLQDPTRFTLSATPVLVLNKTVADDNGGEFVPGEQVTYTLTLENRGTGAATNVVLSDVFPAQLQDLQASPAPSQQSGNALRWDPSTLAALSQLWPNEPVHIVVTARIVSPLADNSAVSNQAQVAADGLAPVLSDNPDSAAPMDATVFFVRSIAVLSEFFKSVQDLDGDGVFRPGDRIRYSLKIVNTGSEDATQIRVTDPLPSVLSGVSAPGGLISGQQVVFAASSLPSLARLAPGAEQDLSIDATLIRPLDPGTLVSNQARVEAQGLTAELSDDPSSAALDDPTNFVVVSAADLTAFSKQVVDRNGGSVKPGDVLDYTLIVSNSGDANAYALAVEDKIDSNLSILTVGEDGQQSAGQIVWDQSQLAGLAQLDVDQQIALHFSAQVASPLDNNTRIANQALLRAQGLVAPIPSDDPATLAVDDPTVVSVVSAADLSGSTKQAFDLSGVALTEAHPGDVVVYVLDIRNSGDAVARDVVVRDELDSNLTSGAISDGGQLQGRTVTWSPSSTPALAALQPGQALSLRVTVALNTPLDNGLLIANQGIMQVADAINPFVTDDPSSPERGDPTLLTVVSAPDLSAFSKSVVDDNGGDFEPGDLLRYEFVISNRGDAVAREIVVEDLVDTSHLQDISSSQGRWDGTRLIFDSASDPRLAEIGVGAGETLRLGFSARLLFPLADGTVVSNQAALTAQDVAQVLSDDPSTAASDDPTRLTVVSQPRLVMQKALTSPLTRIAAPAGEVVYTLRISNGGTASALAVQVTDPLPAELEFVSADQGVYSSATHSLQVVLGDIPAREAGSSIVVRARVRDDVVDETVVSNQARLQSTGLPIVLSDDPDTSAVDDATDLTVRAIIDLSASTKTVTDLDGEALRPGDLLRYSISVINQGNSPAREVVVSDEIEAGLEVDSVAMGGRVEAGRVVWDSTGTSALAAVATGVPVDLVFTARVNTDRQDGDVIANQAVLSYGAGAQTFVTDDPSTPAIPGDPTRVTVQAPRLVFTLAPVDENGAPARPGDILAYHLRARNTGSVPLRGLNIEDPLPEAVSLEAIGQGGQLSNGRVLWTPETSPALQQIEAGQEAELLLRLRIDPRALGGQVIVHQASASSADLATVQLSDDPSTAAALDPTQVVVEASVELDTCTKRAIEAPDPLQSGDRVNFAIDVVNSGTQYAFNLSVADLLNPDQWRNPLAEDGGQLQGESLAWDATTTPALAELAPGDQVSLHLSAVVQDGLSNGSYVENSALVNESSGVSFAIPPVRLRVMALPGLSATTKTVTDLNGGEVEPGDLLRYDIIVRNGSGESLEQVVLRDPPPPGSRFVPGSLLVNGTPLAQGEEDTWLSTGLSLGGLGATGEIPVQFVVQVLPDVVRGTAISNQAWLTALGQPEVGSDDPNTPANIGDPTQVIVGGGPNLRASLQALPRHIDSAETFVLALTVENAGNHPAQAVQVRLPYFGGDQVEYLADSMHLDGLAVSDLDDDDPAQSVAGALTLQVGDLAPGASHQWTAQFSSSAIDTVLYFQAEVLSRSLGTPRLSDGDPASPGVQQTAVYVGAGGADLQASSLSASDLNGGLLEANDQIRYTITLSNNGSASASLSAEQGLLDNIGDQVRFVEGSQEGDLPLRGAADTAIVQLAQSLVLDPGQRLSGSFVVQVLENAAPGQEVLNAVVISTDDGVQIRPEPIRMIIGGLRGTAQLSGLVYEDLGGVADRYDRNIDDVMSGFQVLLRRPGELQAIASQIVDVEGQYAFASVPPGPMEMRVLSQTGALFKTLRFENLLADQGHTQDVLIDPSGVLYDASSGDPVRGAQVLLMVDDGDDDPDNDAIAGPSLVDPDQQGQISNDDGFYRFDVAPGQYRLKVLPASPTQIFPSTLIAPNNDDDSSNPFGSFATTNDQHQVVSAARPDLGGDTSYYLRFDIQSFEDEVLHNHVPIDPLRSKVSLIKSANHKRLSMGELVTYSVRYHNRSALSVDLVNDGGVDVVDTIPKGFKYVAGSARLQQIRAASDGSQRAQDLSSADPAGNRILVFGPYPLEADGKYLLRYQLVATPQVVVGEHDNSAVLRLAQGLSEISNHSVARVRVVPDPTFDLSTVVGKVFCDSDQDGFQDPGEMPLPGVMVYSDIGRHAESDLGGKFHFSGIAPGSHLLKVDWRSLPPESTLTTPERLSFYSTAGLPVRVSFGVNCVFDKHTADQVILAAANDAGPGDLAADAGPALVQVELTGVASQRRIVLDQVPQAVVLADLGIGLGDDERDYSYGGGPNPADIDPVSGLAEKIHFYPRVVTGLPLSDWELQISTSGGQELYHFAGEGLPPDDIAWDGRGAETGAVLLIKGGEYVARLRVNTQGQDWGASAPRNFGVGLGLLPVAALENAETTVQAQLDEAKGALFSRANNPRLRLRKFIQAQAKILKQDPTTKVVVEVHTDDKAGSKSLAISQARADRVKKLLLAAGIDVSRIQATGRGDAQPRVPNIGARGRARNRRVEIRSLKPALRGSPLSPVATQMLLQINGEEHPIVDDSTAFAKSLQVAMGQEIDVDLSAPSGAQVHMHRVYTGAPWTDTVPLIPGVEPVEIVGNMGTRSLRFGEQRRSMSLLDLHLQLADGPSSQAIAVGKKGIERPVSVLTTLPPSATIAHWKILVFAPKQVAPQGTDKKTRPSASRVSESGLPGSGGDGPEVSSQPSTPPDPEMVEQDPALPLPPMASPPELQNDKKSADVAAPAGAGKVDASTVDAAPKPPGDDPAPDKPAVTQIKGLDAFRGQDVAKNKPPADPVGRIVYSVEGEGAPPASWQWDGRNASGALVLQSGWYGLRMTLETAEGDSVQSAPLWFAVAGDQRDETLVLDNPFAKTTKLGKRSRRSLRALVKKHPGAQPRYRVVAHTDNSLKREQAAEETRRWANIVARQLRRLKVAQAQIETVAMGSSAPLVPNLGRRNKLRNRRVEVQVLVGAKVGLAPSQARQSLFIESNGQAIDSDPLGRFSASRYPTRDGLLNLRAVLPSGQEARWTYRRPAAELKTGPGAVDSPELANIDTDAGAGEGEAGAEQFATQPSATDDGTDFDPAVLGIPVLVQLPREDGGVVVDSTDGGATLVLQAEALDAKPVNPHGPDGPDGVTAAAAGVRAAQLLVDLPREGNQLRSRRIVLRGQTDPSNKITVNGEAQEVDPESGRFVAIAQLPEGASTLRIESLDSDGNRAIVKREVIVDSSGLFWLGLAEGSVAGREAELSEWTPVNHYKLGPVALYGRGAALLKADWHNEGFFKDYKLTLHVDTSRWNQDAFARELIDPERYMPVYADSATEFIDAEARYPLYAELRADDSLVQIGNFHTQLKSGDLFRYDRARYGMNARFDKSLFVQKDGQAALDTDVRAFVAGGDAPRRHGRAELRGTGGSLYYLPHDNVVEGSEHIAILVRDAITGTVLMRRPLARNIDYTIRYSEGRVLLNLPLASVAEGALIANQNLSTVYAGHPLSLDVEYEHEGEGDFNQVGVGVWTEDTLYKHFTVGGGYAYEGRADEAPAYQMAGLHLRLAYDERNYVQAEWAYSSAAAMDNYLSTNGGLSFARMGQQPGDPDVLSAGTLYTGARDGHAFKLRGQTALGQLYGANPDNLSASAYVQRMDPGFSTGISAVEAGQTKYGVQSRYAITSKDQLQLRYDGVWSEFSPLSQLNSTRTLHRELMSLQYRRRQGALSLLGEYAFAYTWDSGDLNAASDLSREVWGNTLAAGIEYQLNKRWVLLTRQEAILSGDEQLLQSWNDHLVTSVGARYQIFDNLQLSAMESLRWSGENATTIGLQSKLNDTTDVYSRERFNMRDGHWVSSSVVGASSQVTTSTKAHGEYQLDSAATGQQTRAVMGLATRWKLIEGLALQLGYERTQVFGGSGYAPATGAMTSAALTDSYAFAAAGEQGNQAFYMGSGSRDALSAALDYTQLKDLKAALKLELRYDDLNEQRGGQDRLVLLTQGAMTWRWHRDLALLARFNLADVENLYLKSSEAGLQDLSLGIAYRPVDHEWISVLSKYGRRLEHRPLSLVNGSYEEYSADVLSLEPILELPWHLQLVEKLALKYSREQVDDLPAGDALTLLWINRLNVHLMRMLRPYVDFFPGDIDLGGEWRVLNQLSTGTQKQGLLFELTYAPYEFVRLGMGWNFTSFSDDEFARNDEDYSGFFFRVVGQY